MCFDVRSADYLQRIALALAYQDPKELMRVTAVEHIPRMISEAAWLVDSAATAPCFSRRRTMRPMLLSTVHSRV